jgi:DNA-binding CsgD family transcriptional regulator
MEAEDQIGCEVARGGTQRPIPRQFHPGRLGHVDLRPLTAQEHLVFQLIGEDKSNKQIAAILGVPLRTVESQRLSLSRKLNLKGRQLIVAAVHHVWRIAHQHIHPHGYTYEI